MIEWLSHPLLAWLMTWWIHATALLGGVWLIETLTPRGAPRLREYLWRTAIVASVISATLIATGMVSGPSRWVLSPPTVTNSAAGASIATGAAAWEDESPRPANRRLPLKKTEPVAEAETGPATRVQALPAGRFPAERVLLFAWAAISTLLLARLLLTLSHALRNLGSRCALERSHPAWLMVSRLAARAGARRLPKLTVSACAPGPLSLPGNEICLPRWAIAEPVRRQLEGMLAHELAHCRRRDPLTLVLIDALRRLLFMQPLLWVAQRRLAELAELIADERAVELTGSQRAIAESLSECAGRLRSAPPLEPAWGVSMAREPSAFMHRIGRLLHPERFGRGAPSWRMRAGAVGGALMLSLLLPGFMVEADAAKGGQSTTVLTDHQGRLSVIKLSLTEAGYALEIDGKGGFTLNDEESDLVQMDHGAYLDIEEERDGQRHRVRFEEDNGRIERSFWVEGRRSEFDAGARRWLSEAFPRLMRETGINAEQRAARLFKRGGADLVLDEIDLINGDYARRMYVSWLVVATPLDDRQFDRLVDIIGRGGSDYETRMALTAVSRHQDMSAERAARMLDAAGGIESDYELRTLIEHLVGKTEVERIAAPRLVELAASLDSDYEMRVAFTAMLEKGEFPAAQLPALVATAGRGLDADYELRTLLATAAEFIESSDELALAFVAATQQLDSDYERREALSSFASHAGKNSSAWPNAIQSAAQISGDYERAEALIVIARHMPRTDENLRLYRDALNGLSGHQRKRATRPVEDDVQL